MSAEMVRDSALAAGGLLDRTIGGPSVKPYQPQGIWNDLNSFYDYPAPGSVPDDEHHRRTLYTFVKRNALHPALKIFDFTNRTESVARRRSSNTPLQALNLMNDPQYVEAHHALAAQALRSSVEEDERLARLCRLATRAAPTEETLELVRGYYREQDALFAGDERKTASALAAGVTAPDPALDRVELAALGRVAALLMNSPDAYTVR
jgi:hypothetical protein